ncbi:MAG: hypothetical protein HY075_07430, partial [Deltaproteobacteria bacterium]|nr:hypothetical protein [Deltaproteobacteria bacterium]
AGSAFVHAINANRKERLLVIAHPSGTLGAEFGEFDVRVDSSGTTVYSLSASVISGAKGDDLTSSRKLPVIYEWNFARVGASRTAPDTFMLSRLVKFEGEDPIFGGFVRRIRETRFPLPKGDRGTEGSAATAPTGGALPPGLPLGAPPLGAPASTSPPATGGPVSRGGGGGGGW